MFCCHGFLVAWKTSIFFTISIVRNARAGHESRALAYPPRSKREEMENAGAPIKRLWDVTAGRNGERDRASVAARKKSLGEGWPGGGRALGSAGIFLLRPCATSRAHARRDACLGAACVGACSDPPPPGRCLREVTNGNNATRLRQIFTLNVPGGLLPSPTGCRRARRGGIGLSAEWVAGDSAV